MLAPKMAAIVHFHLNKAFRKRTDNVFDSDEHVAKSVSLVCSGIDGARHDSASVLKENNLEEDDNLRVDCKVRDVLVRRQ